MGDTLDLGRGSLLPLFLVVAMLQQWYTLSPISIAKQFIDAYSDG